MTGLDIERDALIEIACVVTDSDLNLLDGGIDLIIKPPAEALDQMSDVVRDMHTTSGLLADLAGGMTLAEASDAVLAYVKHHVREARKVPLCGNSIATDRWFIARDMPELDNWLHYRMIDVSSVKELARRWYPRAYFASPDKHGGHRALADIIESVRELRYYRDAVFVPQPGPDSATAREIAARYASKQPDGRRAGGRAKLEAFVRTRPDRYTRDSLLAKAHGGCSSAGRAPGCGPGCRGFKSRHSPQSKCRSAGEPSGDDFPGGRRSLPGMTMTTRVQSVSIPVADQDRALAFYTRCSAASCAPTSRCGPGPGWWKWCPPGRASAWCYCPRTAKSRWPYGWARPTPMAWSRPRACSSARRARSSQRRGRAPRRRPADVLFRRPGRQRARILEEEPGGASDN